MIITTHKLGLNQTWATWTIKNIGSIESRRSVRHYTRSVHQHQHLARTHIHTLNLHRKWIHGSLVSVHRLPVKMLNWFPEKPRAPCLSWSVCQITRSAREAQTTKKWLSPSGHESLCGTFHKGMERLSIPTERSVSSPRAESKHVSLGKQFHGVFVLADGVSVEYFKMLKCLTLNHSTNHPITYRHGN